MNPYAAFDEWFAAHGPKMPTNVERDVALAAWKAATAAERERCAGIVADEEGWRSNVGMLRAAMLHRIRATPAPHGGQP